MSQRGTARPDGSGAPQSAALTRRRRRGTGAPQPAALNSGAPQPAALNSGAPQPAALSGAVQKLVENVKQFGRIPMQNKETSEEERAEDRLAKRFSDHRDSIPKDVLQELQALGGAAQPADDEQLVAEASDPEHFLADVNPAALHAQGDALIQAVEELGYYPKLSRDIVCWSKLWDAIGQQ